MQVYAYTCSMLPIPAVSSLRLRALVPLLVVCATGCVSTRSIPKSNAQYVAGGRACAVVSSKGDCRTWVKALPIKAHVAGTTDYFDALCYQSFPGYPEGTFKPCPADVRGAVMITYIKDGGRLEQEVGSKQDDFTVPAPNLQAAKPSQEQIDDWHRERAKTQAARSAYKRQEIERCQPRTVAAPSANLALESQQVRIKTAKELLSAGRWRQFHEVTIYPSAGQATETARMFFPTGSRYRVVMVWADRPEMLEFVMSTGRGLNGKHNVVLTGGGSPRSSAAWLDSGSNGWKHTDKSAASAQILVTGRWPRGRTAHGVRVLIYSHLIDDGCP